MGFLKNSELFNIIKKYEKCNFCEIGVEKGSVLKLIMESDARENIGTFIGVDPYFNYENPNSDFYTQGSVHESSITKRILSRKKYNNHEFDEKIADEIFKKYENATLIKDLSCNFLPNTDLLFDIIYIDGNHQYEYVLQDLKMSYEKLSENGLIIGDDYDLDMSKWCKRGGVKGAVKDFTDSMGLSFYFIDSKISGNTGQYVIKKLSNKASH
jgi:hypothetical protein